MNKKNWVSVLIIILNLVLLNNASAQTTCENGIDPPCDEQATFTSAAPDALFLLDFSGSMAQNPSGGNNIYGSYACVPDTTHCGTNTDPQENGFRSSGTSGCNVNCSKQAILKRAIATILDYDGNKTINSSDSDSLNVRIGYMRFVNGNDTAGNYASGANKLIRGINSAYSQIFCGDATSCSTTTTSCTGTECVDNLTPSGGTPLASALKEAKSYLDYNSSQDNAKACRQKFVIVVSDGSDTYACNSSGNECDDHSYDRRRATVAAVKALRDAGYKVFVIGFGSSMPPYLQNTLNWMAFYGGTDNPMIANVGNTAAYNPANVNIATKCPASGNPPDETTGTSVCNSSTKGTCECPDSSHPDNTWYALINDPGNTPLSGYAFLATDTTSMRQALASAFNTIKESVYTFSQASVQAVRTQDQNFLYEASFQPVNDDPFWIGHLKQYSINADGSIANSSIWDAGVKLQTNTSRNIFTYKAGAITAFNTTNILPADVIAAASTDTTTRDMIVNFIVSGETSPDVTNWKLGDIFHSFPVTIGTPSLYYYDNVDQPLYTCPTDSSQKCRAFDLYRNDNQRDSAGKRIIMIGANDGQLHAFLTSTGNEVWSFIPPNFLPQLQLIAHPAHSTDYGTSALGHQYLMDGFISYGEVWLGTGTGKNKSENDWHTLMVVGEGRGGSTTLWSQSHSCDSNFNQYYKAATTTAAAYNNYCGYYAFDLTVNPSATPSVLKWRIGSNTALSSDDANHLGQPWSKMMIGRVNINGNEQWVGFISGGYSGSNWTTTTSVTRGKGFYVIDLATGNVLWSYTRTKNNTSMNYDLVANPAAVDTDNDGFVDTVYVGDLGGNVWRFNLCKIMATSDAPYGKCTQATSVNDWRGGLMFDAQGTGGQIFHMADVARDSSGYIWVYFGTGNETDPTVVPTNGTTDKFFALIDKKRTNTTLSSIGLSNLKDITLNTFNSAISSADMTNYSGWVLKLTTPGEKVLSEAAVFQGAIYFTTYVPGNASNVCDQGGTANLYALNYMTSGGLLSGNARSEVIGSGIPSSPIVSIGPTGLVSVYASTSASNSSGAQTQSLNSGTRPNTCPSPPNCPFGPTAPGGYLHHWLDLRLQ